MLLKQHSCRACVPSYLITRVIDVIKTIRAEEQVGSAVSRKAGEMKRKNILEQNDINKSAFG